MLGVERIKSGWVREGDVVDTSGAGVSALGVKMA